jgi:Protein of unknown function (DUF4236)
MRFNFRKRIRLGPFFWSFTTRGLTSWGVRIWRYTWNARSGRSTFDTPGPGSVSFGGGRPRRRSATRR